ncbi:MAG: hypothetical protein GON13_02685 [Nanoarchaeota archaeon]|nr:hypothetical protein [Nanoarchaeota archaeon]
MGKILRPWVKIVLTVLFLALLIFDLSGSITGFFTKNLNNTINFSSARENGLINNSFRMLLNKPVEFFIPTNVIELFSGGGVVSPYNETHNIILFNVLNATTSFSYAIDDSKLINYSHSSIIVEKPVNWIARVKAFNETFALKKVPEGAVNISLVRFNDYFEIVYSTPAPVKKEFLLINNSNLVKNVLVSSVFEGYENVSVSTNVPTKTRFRIYEISNNSPVDITNNSDYNISLNNSVLSWIIPYLINQTFRVVIEITNAMHLDENYSLISNVFEEVKELDDAWSEPIYENEFLRVIFEQNLTAINDITVYVRNNQSFNTLIEVYYFNTSKKITEFPIIISEKYYKIYLIGMEGSHNTFDLRIVNDDSEIAFLEFNHVIDPPPPQSTNVQTNNSDVFENEVVQHEAEWSDNTALSGYKFFVNASEVDCSTVSANESWVEMPASNLTWINKSWPSQCWGKTVEWKIWANDSNDEWNVTETQLYTVYEHGELQVSLQTPSDDITWGNITMKWFNTTIVCGGTTSGAKCGSVSGGVRYNASITTPDTIVSTSEAIPFYTGDSNPQSCGVLVYQDVCQLNWSLNVTGTINDAYELDVNFTSSYNEIGDNSTSNVTITIIPSHLLSGTLEDGDSTAVLVNFTFYELGTQTVEYDFDTDFSGDYNNRLDEGYYDLVINAFNNKLNITVYNVSINESFADKISFDDSPNDDENMGSLTGVEMVMFNLSLNFDYAEANISYSSKISSISSEDNLRPFKCDDWDFNNRVCNGNWMELTNFSIDKVNNVITVKGLEPGDPPIELDEIGNSTTNISTPVNDSYITKNYDFYVNASICSENGNISNCVPKILFYTGDGDDLSPDAWTYGPYNITNNSCYYPNWTITVNDTGSYNITINTTCEFGSPSNDLAYNLTIRVVTVEMSKYISQNWVLPKTVETINVNTTLENNGSNNPVYFVEIIDEVPGGFTAPSEGSVDVWHLGSSNTLLSSGFDVTVSDIDADPETEINLTIYNMSETNIGTYLMDSEKIRIYYSMISSELDVDVSKIFDANTTINNTDNTQYIDSLWENITSSHAFLKSYKSLDIDEVNPLNASITFILKAVGGNITDIHIADYLPVGASIDYLNITYNNDTIIELSDGTDYIKYASTSELLPDGLSVDIYKYNFSTGLESAWDGTLYESDTINVTMNVSIIGGGTWVLPTIIAGFDPTYKKHVNTETHVKLVVPLFDTILELLDIIINPGERVKALLTILNIGGPKATVDVAITYSAKTLEGNLITESTDTIAVTDQVDKELVLRIPEKTRSGVYAFEALVTYAGREAISTRTFEVKGSDTSSSLIWVLVVILFGVIVVLTFRIRTVKIERYDKLTLTHVKNRAVRKNKKSHK